MFIDHQKTKNILGSLAVSTFYFLPSTLYFSQTAFSPNGETAVSEKSG
jgi:hypothetical protein